MRHLISEKGQAMVEFAVLFATVVIIAALTFGSMSEAVVRVYDQIRTVLIPAFP